MEEKGTTQKEKYYQIQFNSQTPISTDECPDKVWQTDRAEVRDVDEHAGIAS